MSINALDIFAITETWTNDSISSDYLNVDGYVRRDRNATDRGRGGGIIVYVYADRDARDSDVDRDAEDINEMWLSLKKILGLGHEHVCPFVEKETDKLTKMAEL